MDYEPIEGGGFCTDCGLRIDSFMGLNSCPNCGSSNLPCADSDQVDVNINWHELYILCVWAERFAHEHLEGAGTVYSIAGRIERQFPEFHPLTLAGEVDRLKDVFGPDNIETNIPGVE